MGVGAGDAERTDTGPAWAVDGRPRAVLTDHRHPEVAPGNRRTGLRDVERRRNLALSNRKRRLDQSGDPSRGLGVADVGLDRADQARFVGRPSGSEHVTDGPDLNRVTGGGSRAVSLHILDGSSIDPSSPVGPAEHLGLTVSSWRSQGTAGPAVVGHRAAADDRVDAVAGLQGIGQPLEGHDADALAPDIAVGRGVTELAPAVWGQHLRPGVGEGDRRVENDVGSAGQGHVALAAAQALDRQVDRNQR